MSISDFPIMDDVNATIARLQADLAAARAERDRLILITDRATEIIRNVVADLDEIDLTHAIRFLEGHDTGPGEYAKLLDEKHRVVDELGAAKGTIGVLKQDAEHNANRAEKAEAERDGLRHQVGSVQRRYDSACQDLSKLLSENNRLKEAIARAGGVGEKS